MPKRKDVVQEGKALPDPWHRRSSFKTLQGLPACVNELTEY